MITHVNETASIHSVQYRPTPDSQLMDANKERKVSPLLHGKRSS